LPAAPPSSSPTVYAVIPAFDAVAQTLRCLRSLADGDLAPTAVVVEHGPDDEAAVRIAREFPHAVVLRGDATMWWAAATNAGVRHAMAHGADYVLTFNCDGVVDRATVRALVESQRRVGRALVGAQQRLLHDPDRFYNAGACFGASRETWFRMPRLEGEELLRIDAIGANCLLIPRACFEEIGLFDEHRLPQTWSDFDLQLRARSAGWSVYCIAAAVVWVDVSTTGLGITRDTGLRRAAMLLTDRRSPYHVVHHTRFVLRHAPRRIVAARLARRYRPLAAAVVGHHGRSVRAALRRMAAPGGGARG
jgi:GT2 family glycosyltransferase